MKAKFVNEFQRGIDPKRAMDVGLYPMITKWLKENTDGINIDLLVTINKDFTIDVNDKENISLYISWYTLTVHNAPPDYIKFGDIGCNFDLTYIKDLKNLDFFPDRVRGSLKFYENNIELTEEEIRDICEVDGTVYEFSEEIAKKRRNEKRKQGYNRVTDKWSGTTFASGWKLWKTLMEIQKRGSMTRYEIMEYMHDLKHGEGSFADEKAKDKKYQWGVSYFTRTGAITKYTDTNGKEYFLNREGKEYLAKNTEKFEKMIDE
jgi:hypothetical protein